MKSVVIIGKRTKPGSPRADWPDAEIAGTTGSQQKYMKKLGPIEDWNSWWDLHPIHPKRFYQGIKALRPKTYEWFQTLPGPDRPDYRPLWLLEKDPTIPAGVVFPVDEVLEAFPIRNGEGHWYTCQLDWMMAYFLLRGVQHVILAGHGVSRDLTHMVKHRGILHWITVARERGVKVTVLPPSWFIAPRKPYAIESGGGADTWQ